MSTLLRRLRAEGGFSLTELLVVMVFLGVLSAAFSMMLSSMVRHETEIKEQSSTQGELRFAVDRVMREIRQAYAGGGAWPIESVSSSQIQFTTPDRSVPFRLRRVAYRVSGGKLQRAFYTSTNAGSAPWTWPQVGTPTNWSTVASNITSATPFSFLDAAGSATTTASAVRTVSVTLTFATKTAGTRTYTYTSSASPRTDP